MRTTSPTRLASIAWLFIALVVWIGPDETSVANSSTIVTSRQEERTPDESQMSPQRRTWGRRPVQGVYKDGIAPHWLGDNARFWYRNDLSGGAREFILINAKDGTRARAFDHARLAKALSEAAGAEYEASRLPFDSIELTDDLQTVRFAVEQTTWACDLTSYVCSKAQAMAPQPDTDEPERPRRRGRRPGPSADAPDGRWTAVVKDYNVFLRDKNSEQETQLSTDGKEGNAYDMLSWAPDSQP